jgi:hypothetical protein
LQLSPIEEFGTNCTIVILSFPFSRRNANDKSMLTTMNNTSVSAWLIQFTLSDVIAIAHFICLNYSLMLLLIPPELVAIHSCS